MKKEELIIRINDAADGLLGVDEIRALELDLKMYPELMEMYQEVMALPDFKKAYPMQQDDIRIWNIKKMLKADREKRIVFEELAWIWFRKFGVAAAIVLLSFTFVLRIYIFSGDSGIDMDAAWNPYENVSEESTGELYMSMLDNFLND